MKIKFVQITCPSYIGFKSWGSEYNIPSVILYAGIANGSLNLLYWVSDTDTFEPPQSS
jgi:hypothetical protein